MSRKNRRICCGPPKPPPALLPRLFPASSRLLQGGLPPPDVALFPDESAPPVNLHLFTDPQAAEQLLEPFDGGHRVLLRDQDGNPQRLGAVPDQFVRGDSPRQGKASGVRLQRGVLDVGAHPPPYDRLARGAPEDPASGLPV